MVYNEGNLQVIDDDAFGSPAARAGDDEYQDADEEEDILREFPALQ